MKDQKLPVVVGGTNYYIEALLWDYLITEVRYQFLHPWLLDAIL